MEDPHEDEIGRQFEQHVIVRIEEDLAEEIEEFLAAGGDGDAGFVPSIGPDIELVEGGDTFEDLASQAGTPDG